MKREAINHTKMRRLARLLGIELWGARGIMESLWHVTGEEAPAGDIGKLSDDDIADAIGWSGDAAKLIDGLVGAKWLDTTPTYRLVVHDWPEHCADHIHAKVARAHTRFANGAIPKVSKLKPEERKALTVDPVTFPMPPCGVYAGLPKGLRGASEPGVSPSETLPASEPYPTLPNPTQPNPAQPSANVRQMPSRTDTDQVAGEFLRWIDPWERVADIDSACRMWNSVVTPETLEPAFACRDRYLGSDEVARGAWMEPWKFIRDQSRNGWSGKWPRARETPRPSSQPDNRSMLL